MPATLSDVMAQPSARTLIVPVGNLVSAERYGKLYGKNGYVYVPP